MHGWQAWLAAVLVGVLMAVVAILAFRNRDLQQGHSALLAESDTLAKEAVVQAKRANIAVLEADKFRLQREDAEAAVLAAQDRLVLERARANRNAERIAKLPKPRDIEEAKAHIAELRRQLEFQKLTLQAADDTIAEQRTAMLFDAQTIDALQEALYHRDREAELYKGATKKERQHSNILSRAVRRERAKKAGVAIGAALAGFGGGYATGKFL